MKVPVSFINKILFHLPFIGKRLRLLDDCGYRPGHYYSPIPNLDEIRERRNTIFGQKEIKGIDLRKEAQFEWLQKFSGYYKELPYDFTGNSDSGTRYQVSGDWYKYSDAIMLYSVMRHFRPSKIIEVGSGYSSAVMLDTAERFLDPKPTITFIDPYPERLLSLLNEEDKKNNRIIKSKIQDVDPGIFTELGNNDILFIDSSHVSKAGSDLNHILFEILPVLNKGVLVHFHDIFYPFEMPENWVVEKKWFWNENYILRAYLTGNRDFEIINFNSYLHKEYRDWFKTNMPACLIKEEETGSIWIRKIS